MGRWYDLNCKYNLIKYEIAEVGRNDLPLFILFIKRVTKLFHMAVMVFLIQHITEVSLKP